MTTSLKSSENNWVNQRATGKNSKLVNAELDRIEEALKEFVSFNPTHVYTPDQIKLKIDSIIKNSEVVDRRKSIGEYFEDFLNEKSGEVNNQTRNLITTGTIQSYQNSFQKLMEFENLELEQINKVNYHKFLTYLLENFEPNTGGKIIRRLKTFFIWCDLQALPISNEWKYWKPISQETEEETRALNSEQLDSIYNLVIDPVEVYKIAKRVHDKMLDGKQVDDLSASIDEARKQAVAIASIGPHIKDFYKLDDSNVHGDVIKYNRGKNKILCVAPFTDNQMWHAREFANLNGGKLFKRLVKINYYLTYVKELCDLPFPITASNFRKTFGSIIWHESDHPNKLGVIMKAYGHKKESTTRKYLGIQEDDLRQDHKELFGF